MWCDYPLKTKRKKTESMLERQQLSCACPSVQTQVPTHKIHVLGHQRGQDPGQARRGKQGWQCLLPYLLHRPPASPTRDSQEAGSRPSPLSVQLLPTGDLIQSSQFSSTLALQGHCAVWSVDDCFTNSLPAWAEKNSILWTQVLNGLERPDGRWGGWEAVDGSVPGTAPSPEGRVAGPSLKTDSPITISTCAPTSPPLPGIFNCWCSYTQMKYLATVIKWRVHF